MMHNVFMQLSLKDIEQMTQILLNQAGLITAILYGSQASGTAGPQSDVDLALAGTQKLSPERMIEVSQKLEKLLGLTVQVRDLRRANGLFLNQVLTKGKILVSRDDLFLTELIIQNLDYMTDVYPAYYSESLRQNQEYFHG